MPKDEIASPVGLLSADGPLQVGSEGGNGATQVVISFTGNAPTAGKCILTQKVKSYDDGAHTLRSLKADGYILTKTVRGMTRKLR